MWTLFPYTTLFRSKYGMDGKAVGAVLRAHDVVAFLPENWDAYLGYLKAADDVARVRAGYAPTGDA
jgi:hypothetical protein